MTRTPETETCHTSNLDIVPFQVLSILLVVTGVANANTVCPYLVLFFSIPYPPHHLRSRASWGADSLADRGAELVTYGQDYALDTLGAIFSKSQLGGLAGSVTEAAASMVPFGKVAFGLCKTMYGKYQQMGANQKMAHALEMKVKVVVMFENELMRALIIATQEERKDKREGMETTIKTLLSVSFKASKLVHHVANKKGEKKVTDKLVRFLGAGNVQNAIEDAIDEFKEARNEVSFVLGAASLSGGSSATGASLGGPQGGSRSSMQNPFQGRKDVPADAIDFWMQHGYGTTVPLDDLAYDLYGYVGREGEDPLENESLIKALVGSMGEEGNHAKTRVVTSKRFIHVFVGKSKTLQEALNKLVASEGRQADQAAAEQKSDSVVNLKLVLEPANFQSDYANHLSQFATGTREWVFDDYERWIQGKVGEGSSQVMWINGVGGLGKSVIAAQICDRYDESVVAAFFCKHTVDNRNDPKHCVRTLAFQLSERFEGLREELSDMPEDVLQGTAAGASTVEELFEKLIAGPLRNDPEAANASAEPVVIVIDALDELREGLSRAQMLGLVANHLPSLPGRFRVLVTSRPEEDISRRLAKLEPMEIDKNGEEHKKDLFKFTRSEVVDKISGSKAEKEKLVELMIEKSDGVFLALRLMGDDIKSLDAKKAIELIKDKKDFLDDTYRETLDRVWDMLERAGQGNQELADEYHAMLKRTLSVLVVSKRELSFDELGAMVSTTSAGFTRSTEILMGSLSLLYTATSRSSPYRPLHKTVHDFLRDKNKAGEKYWVNDVEANAMVARRCAAVLSRPQSYPEKAVDYVTRFGHVHLAQALRAMREGDQNAQQRERVSELVAVWDRTLLVMRSAEKMYVCEGGDRQEVSTCESEATTQCGMWLARHFALGASQVRRLTAELNALRGLIGGGDGTTDSQGGRLANAIDDLAKLLGRVVLKEVKKGHELWKTAWDVQVEAPVTGTWHQSEASNALLTTAGMRKSGTAWVQRGKLPMTVALGGLLAELVGHSYDVTSVCFSPDGSTVVTALIKLNKSNKTQHLPPPRPRFPLNESPCQDLHTTYRRRDCSTSLSSAMLAPDLERRPSVSSCSFNVKSRTSFISLFRCSLHILIACSAVSLISNPSSS